LVIAILVAICLTIIIPLTLSRSAGPIQLGDNRTAERDRLAKEYGVSKETANQIMVDLERQTGKRILNSVDLPDGAALDFYHVDGNRTPGHMTEFQGTGWYYKATSTVGQAYRATLEKCAKTKTGEWAQKQLDQGREHGFYVIPASIVPGGATIAKAIGNALNGATAPRPAGTVAPASAAAKASPASTTGKTGTMSPAGIVRPASTTTPVRIAIVATDFPAWVDHHPYFVPPASGTNGINNDQQHYVVADINAYSDYFPREFDIKSNNGFFDSYNYGQGAGVMQEPSEFFADGPGGPMAKSPWYGYPVGLSTVWDTTNLEDGGTGGQNAVPQATLVNDWTNRLFGPLSDHSAAASLASYYYENSHGNISIQGDSSSVIGWLYSHHTLDRNPMREVAQGKIQPTNWFFQPATPLLRPYPAASVYSGGFTCPHIVCASLNVNGLVILFDRDVDSPPTISGLQIFVDNTSGATPATPGSLGLNTLKAAWVQDPWDNRRWTLTNPGGNSWIWTNTAATPANFTWTPVTTTYGPYGAPWSLTISATAHDTATGTFSGTFGGPCTTAVGSQYAYTGGQGGGSVLWVSGQSGLSVVYGTTFVGLRSGDYSLPGDTAPSPTDASSYGDTFTKSAYQANITEGLTGTTSDEYTHKHPLYSDPEQYCRLKSFAYYTTNHSFSQGSGQPYQLAHIRNEADQIDDIGGTHEDAQDQVDRMYPFDHSNTDGANNGNVLAVPLGQQDHTSAVMLSDISKVLQDEGISLSGYTDVITVYPGGGGAEGSNGNAITAHAGAGLTGAGNTTVTGIVVPETAGLTLLAHEMGHQFGEPDLYDTDLYSNAALPPPSIPYFESLMMGDLAVMAHGVRMDAWSKLQRGWATEIDITQDTPGAQIEATEGTLRDPQILKLPANPYLARTAAAASTWDEYYLLENRYTVGGSYFGDPSAQGLYIYHIDNRAGASQACEVAPHVIVIPADGKKILTSQPAGFDMSQGQGGISYQAGVPFPGQHYDTSTGATLSTPNFTWYPDHSYHANDPGTGAPQVYNTPTAFGNGKLQIVDATAGGDHSIVDPKTLTDSFTRVVNISNPGQVISADLYVQPAEVIVQKLINSNSPSASGAPSTVVVDSTNTWGPPSYASSGVVQGNTNQLMLTLRLTNASGANTWGGTEMSTNDVVLNNLDVLESGTSQVVVSGGAVTHSDIDSASLWADTNGTAGLQTGTGGDTLLATVPISTDNTFHFTGLGYRIKHTSTFPTTESAFQHLYVTYNVDRLANLTPRVTVGAELVNNYNFMPVEPGATQYAQRTGPATEAAGYSFGAAWFPVVGDTAPILPHTNVMQVSTVSVAPATSPQGTSNIPMLKARCSVNTTEVPPLGQVQIKELKVWAVTTSGHAAPLSGYTTASVYLDPNDDGVIDASANTPLSQTTFAAETTNINPGTGLADPSGTLVADFTNFSTPIVITAGTPVSLLFTIGLAVDPNSLPAAPDYKDVTLQLRNDGTYPAYPTQVGPSYNYNSSFILNQLAANNDAVATTTFTNGDQTMVTPMKIVAGSTGPQLDPVPANVTALAPPNRIKYGTPVTYQVYYRNPGNLPPAKNANGTSDIWVYIDPVLNPDGTINTPGTPYAMTQVDPTITNYTSDVLFSFTTSSVPINLSMGPHTYYYQAWDGKALQADGKTPAYAQLVNTGNVVFLGPEVNHPPTLTNGQCQVLVSGTWEPAPLKAGGTNATTSQSNSFRFSVQYHDLDGDAPKTIQVVTTQTTAGAVAKTFTLTQNQQVGEDTVADTGITYSYTSVPGPTGTQPIGDGDHTFYFTATDTPLGEAARFPTDPTTSIAGPFVNDPPNAVSAGFSPANGIGTGPAPLLKWTATTDPNPDDIPATIYYVVELSANNTVNPITGSFTAPITPAITSLTTAVGVTQIQFVAGDNLPTGTLYWHVQAFDQYIAASAWSAIQTFSIVAAPQAPVLTSVVDPSTGGELDLTWTPSPSDSAGLPAPSPMPPTNQVTGYNVFRWSTTSSTATPPATTDPSWLQITTTPVVKSTTPTAAYNYQDLTAKANTYYYYFVEAVGISGSSVPSNVLPTVAPGATPTATKPPVLSLYAPTPGSAVSPVNVKITVRILSLGVAVPWTSTNFQMYVDSGTGAGPQPITFSSIVKTTGPTGLSGDILASYTTTLPYNTTVTVTANATNANSLTGSLSTNNTFTTAGLSISGTIANGVADLPVVATPISGSPTTAYTNLNGTYTITPLIPGTYTVAPGNSLTSTYVFTPVSTSVTLTNASATGVNFTASTGYAIAGYVLNDSAQPIPGVTITAGTYSATSAADGSFRLPSTAGAYLPAGTYNLTASKALYAFDAIPAIVLPPTPPATTVNITEHGRLQTFAVSGTVTDSSANGIGGVTITATPTGSGTGATVQTAANTGSYTLPLQPGQYTVTPSLNNYLFSPTSQSVTVSNAAVPNINFKGAPTFGPVSIAAGLTFLGLPIEPLDPSPGVVFGPNVTLYRYDPTATPPAYAQFPTTGTVSSVLQVHAGRGFWVGQQYAQSINMAGVVTPESPFSLSLQTGWNMAANPFNHDIDWSQLNVPSGGAVSPYGYIWSQSTGYQIVTSLTGVSLQHTIRNQAGVWLHATNATTLTVAASMSTAGATTSTTQAPARAAGDYVMPISARGGGLCDQSAVAGIVAAAGTAGYQFLKPPVIGSSISVYFPAQDGGRLATDIRGTGTGTQTWSFVVEADVANTTVTVALPDLTTVPNNMSVTLTDLDANKSVYARTMTGYSYNSGTAGGVRHFQITVAPAAAGGLTLNVAAAVQTAGAAQVNYTLSRPASVTVTVMNIAGIVVRNVVQGQSGTAGVNVATWNLHNDAGNIVPSGRYLIQIEAVADDGQMVRTLGQININR
jgi:M6 family metalloprotease-like protein